MRDIAFVDRLHDIQGRNLKDNVYKNFRFSWKYNLRNVVGLRIQLQTIHWPD